MEKDVAGGAGEATSTGQDTRAGSEMIKLVIWDLDETFWQGTLAEDGEVFVPEENISILKELTGRGIVNAICSKNHFDAARAVLQERGLWDYFVFPRIAFAPKGEAVTRLIADMGLRAVNVLFVDDNHGNLAEVVHYNPGIQVMDAVELPRLLGLPGAEGKPDPGHSRLGHYRLLEQRHEALGEATSNEEFLRASGLCIELAPSRPEDAARIHDMVMRTNQLNFTKKRISLAEVEELLADPSAESGTVRVRDRFGDYGVVGWYYVRAGVLEHYLFSCRTINLGIEQHLYAHLGHPRLDVVGETAAEVGPGDELRDYITIIAAPSSATAAGPASSAVLASEEKLQLFLLSACDLYQVVGKLALPLTEVTFECNTFRGQQRGVNVGSDYIRSCFEMSEESKAFCVEHFSNYAGSTVFDTQIFARPYDYVVLSFHDDLSYEVYRHRERSDLVVQLDLGLRRSLRALPRHPYYEPLILSGDQGEEEPGQSWLEEHFECEGLITPERFAENLGWILDRLHPDTQVILVTSPEMRYYRNYAPDVPLVWERAILLNAVLRDFCARQERAHLVEINDFIFDRSHVSDYVMHLVAERTHVVAGAILEQLAAHPSRMRSLGEDLGVGGRRVALWESNPDRIGIDALAMRAAGLAPDEIVVPHWDGRETPYDVKAGATLNARRDEVFVFGVREPGDGWLEPVLGLYGYRPGEDLRVAAPPVFAPDWNEAL